MPEKDAGDGPAAEARARSSHPAKYRRPRPEDVERAARRALARHGRPYASQAELRRALLPLLRDDDPLVAIGGRRMRRLLIGSGQVRVRVRYTARSDRAPLATCPVCDAEVRPIRNRTLTDDRVTLGYRCTRCAYWTRLKRRVPVRYAFAPASSPRVRG